MNELELRDIHLPDAVSWWPPAMGWWVLLLIFVLMIIAVIFLVKKMRQVSVRQMALSQLQKIKTDFEQQKNKTVLSQQLSQLLRQILLSTHPREAVASVSGQHWLSMMKQSHPKGVFEGEWLEQLTMASYQKQSEFDEQSLLNHVEQWIASYPKGHLL